ncbi:MAG: hypothetical protein ITG02_07565 [Patulibacter sp.]|nr:hypothetical protein [Patulibacter sp.]
MTVPRFTGRAWAASPVGMLAITLLLTVVALGTMSSKASARSGALTTGFMENGAFGGADRGLWFDRSVDVGAGTARINLAWDTVAPVAPPASSAADPAWPGYLFASVDAQIQAAIVAGLRPILNVSRAPTWAEAPGRPGGIGRGSWKPDVGAYGRFVSAVARRYSGTFVDPVSGQKLPRITRFQLWNEPNLDTYLAPQWERGRPFAPGRFRELVNAGYRSIKAVQSKATVAAAGLAPFGDHRTTSGKRMPPIAFLRSMLCLDRELRRSCRQRTTVDVVAHHPYAIREPSSPALNDDDATVPDLGKVTRVVRAARKARTVGPKTPKLWVTEVSYDSSPPDPNGVPTARLSRWIAELLWRVWDQGADTVIWYLLRDAAPTPSYDATYQSGMYLLDGTRKPSARAFRFPLVVTARRRDRLHVWWRSPRSGRVAIQVRQGNRWRTVRRVRTRTGGVGRTTVPAARTRSVRAVVGGESSYAWSGSPASKVRR